MVKAWRMFGEEITGSGLLSQKSPESCHFPFIKNGRFQFVKPLYNSILQWSMPIFHLYFLPECTVGRIWGYGLLFHLNCVYEKREYKYKCANLNATKHRDTEAQSPWLHRTRERNKLCASVSLCLKSFHFDASPRCHPEESHDARRETHARCIVTAIATTAPTMSETTTASILSLFHKKASNSHVTTKQTRKAHKKVKKCCFIIIYFCF